MAPDARFVSGAPIRALQLLVSTQLGGGPAHVRDLVAGLSAEQFELTVAGPGGGPCVDEFRALGADFVDVGADRLSVGTLIRVIRLVRQRRIQIIHSHGKGAGLYGRVAAWLTGAAAIHTFHGIHPGRHPRLYLWMERTLAWKSYALVHVCPSQARDAGPLGLAPEGRSVIITNATDAPRVRARAVREPLSRAALGLPFDAPVLGTVARFDPVKGLDVLLRAFAHVIERLPRARLLVVGDGPEAQALHHLARSLRLGDRVIFTGAIPEAARCLPALDLYVTASHREGLPLAVLEAMACGLAIVATRTTGHVDLVEDGTSGLLVPPGEPAALAAAAVALLEDPARRRAMGQAGQGRAETRFVLARMVDEVAALYRQAARFPRRAPHLPGV